MNTRLAFVDTLRGVAVGVVLLQHSLEQIILTQTTGAYEGRIQDVTGYYFNFGRFRRRAVLFCQRICHS